MAMPLVVIAQVVVFVTTLTVFALVSTATMEPNVNIKPSWVKRIVSAL
jgi:hypothetical protein